MFFFLNGTSCPLASHTPLFVRIMSGLVVSVFAGIRRAPPESGSRPRSKGRMGQAFRRREGIVIKILFKGTVDMNVFIALFCSHKKCFPKKQNANNNQFRLRFTAGSWQSQNLPAMLPSLPYHILGLPYVAPWLWLGYYIPPLTRKRWPGPFRSDLVWFDPIRSGTFPCGIQWWRAQYKRILSTFIPLITATAPKMMSIHLRRRDREPLRSMLIVYTCTERFCISIGCRCASRRGCGVRDGLSQMFFVGRGTVCGAIPSRVHSKWTRPYICGAIS